MALVLNTIKCSLDKNTFYDLCGTSAEPVQIFAPVELSSIVLGHM